MRVTNEEIDKDIEDVISKIKQKLAICEINNILKYA